MLGKKLPLRSLGMPSSMSPALVDSVLGRVPVAFGGPRLRALVQAGPDLGAGFGFD